MDTYVLHPVSCNPSNSPHYSAWVHLLLNKLLVFHYPLVMESDSIPIWYHSHQVKSIKKLNQKKIENYINQKQYTVTLFYSLAILTRCYVLCTSRIFVGYWMLEGNGICFRLLVLSFSHNWSISSKMDIILSIPYISYHRIIILKHPKHSNSVVSTADRLKVEQ